MYLVKNSSRDNVAAAKQGLLIDTVETVSSKRSGTALIGVHRDASARLCRGFCAFDKVRVKVTKPLRSLDQVCRAALAQISCAGCYSGYLRPELFSKDELLYRKTTMNEGCSAQTLFLY